MRKKIVVSGLALFLLMVPELAFAQGWVEEKVSSAIEYVLMSIFKPVYDTMIDALGNILITPSLTQYEYVTTAMHYSQIIAASLLVTQFVFRLWRAQTSHMFTGSGEPAPMIIWKCVMSAVLIYGLPEILNTLIKINYQLIEGIKSIGVDMPKGLAAIAWTNNANLTIVVFLVIWVIALIGLTISNAVRFAELVVLYVLGPIMAVSQAGKGEAFQIWVMQAVAVTFTQALQYFLVGLALNWSTTMEFTHWYSYLLPIGAVVIAIRGPQMLKQYLYSTGVAGSLAGAGKQLASTAIYKKMMRG